MKRVLSMFVFLCAAIVADTAFGHKSDANVAWDQCKGASASASNCQTTANGWVSSVETSKGQCENWRSAAQFWATPQQLASAEAIYQNALELEEQAYNDKYGGLLSYEAGEADEGVDTITEGTGMYYYNQASELDTDPNWHLAIGKFEEATTHYTTSANYYTQACTYYGYAQSAFWNAEDAFKAFVP